MPKYLMPVAVSLVALAVGSAQALPQKLAERGKEPGPGESPFQSGVMPIVKKPEGQGAILHTMADELGMVRLNLFKKPPGEDLDVVNRLQIGGSGTMTDPKTKASYKLTHFVYGMAIHSGSSRLDVERTDAAGKPLRTVEVLAGDRAWNEVTPGVGGKYVPDEVRIRKALLTLWPQAFARAALKAPAQQVKVVEAGDVTTVTVPVDGVPVTATLDADYRPAKIVLSYKDPKRGAVKLEADYARYRDLTEYGVMFPRDVVLKLNGATVYDIKIDDARVGPYLIFPQPSTTAASR